jgi:hypothetical protein
VVLYPGDAWEIGTAHDNGGALCRYDRAYGARARAPLRVPGESVSIAQLQEAFVVYRTRIQARNSRWLLALLSRLPFLGVLQPLVIRLTDLGTAVSFSPVKGIAPLAHERRAADVAMHSSSLLFLLRNDFGYDTLTVNGRFEASAQGFSKMTRTFGIGSLNAMGASLSPALIFNFRFLSVLARRLRMLRRVQTRLKSRAAAPQVP